MHFDWSTLVLQLLNFGVLVWLLKRFLYGPVLAMIDARRVSVQQHYDAAKAAEDRAKALTAEIEAQRTAVAGERTGLLAAAEAEAKALGEVRRAEAEAQAKVLLEAGRTGLTAERERAKAELARNALDLGADFARRLLAEMGADVTSDAWIAPVERKLRALPEAEVAGLTAQLADGGVLRVVTASVLTPAAQGLWRARLVDCLGPCTTEFADDAGLIAGAELHFPAAVLRISAKAVLANLYREVDGHGDIV